MNFCPRDATPLQSPVSGTEAQVTAGLARRYHIIRRLGEGGMGTVFLAEQIALGNRPVALKVLRRKLLDDPEFLQRFADEASSAGRISHRNVVTLYECGQAGDGSPYIAMEYLDGESVREILGRRGTLPRELVVEILMQAARGLHAAHRLGIIHRDLKPDNIFLSRDEEGKPLIKILDFGIAKMRESSIRTVTGLAIGTPAYMSVQQAAGMHSSEMDGRSDIYSLGIVVYEMLTGRLPFDADTPMAYLSRHLVEQPIPLRQARPELAISAAVERAVMKALRKDRKERYVTAPEFAIAVEQAFLGTAARPASAPHSPQPVVDPSPPKDLLKRRPIVPLFASAWLFGMLLAGGTGWYVYGRHGQEPSAQHSIQRGTSRKATPNPVGELPAQDPQKGAQALSSRQPSAETLAKVRAAIARGDLLLKRGEYDEAIAEYQKGLRVSPSDPTLRENIEHAARAKAAEQRVTQQ